MNMIFWGFLYPNKIWNDIKKPQKNPNFFVVKIVTLIQAIKIL